MFKKLLIANRGEIACRIIKTARRMGIATVAVYSDADRNALHVKMADHAVHIGASSATESYIAIDNILAAVRKTGADAVHPGYGFLSENKNFAAALADAGVVFVGPPAAAIEAMGDKITSKKIAAQAGVATVPGFMGLIENADVAVNIANDIGYPVMIKASAGGGGKGMRIAWTDQETREGFQSSKNEAAASFGDDRIFIEKFITRPRHIEIQVLADAHGHIIHLGERECSIQRRNQKVIEEAPSPFLNPETRRTMGEQAVALARAVGYVSAGTVEFIVDATKNFYFLEMNTRLQVEHPVTELVTGIDIVEQMLRVAHGEHLSITQTDVALTGCAIESRLYAEDPYRDFLPSIGRLTRYRPPTEVAAGPLYNAAKWHTGASNGTAAVRNDTGVQEGGDISVFYDPMIAKLCTWAPTRDMAIDTMRAALDEFEVEGIGHNLPFLSAVMDHQRFISGDITTTFIAEEYPDGFQGMALDAHMVQQVAATVATLHRISEIRRTQISGRLGNHAQRIADDWIVTLQDQDLPLRFHTDANGLVVSFADGQNMRVTSTWTPGDTIAQAKIDDASLTLKVTPIVNGFRVRVRGADVIVRVRRPRLAELAQLMPEKRPPDTSKMLLCPMPGLLVKIDVDIGQTVQEGQPLCTVEAMKMENILRAERHAVITKINVALGDTLAVDDVIMEFD